MNSMKRSGMGLVLASGIIETVIAFVAYWVFYALDSGNLVTPMVILMFGMLGGILAIIGSVLIKSTRLAGPILSMIAAGLELFATLYLIVMVGAKLTALNTTAIMVILPFFILPNALAIAGATMALVPPKDQEAPEQPKAE